MAGRLVGAGKNAIWEAVVSFGGTILNVRGEQISISPRAFIELRRVRTVDRDSGVVIKALRWDKAAKMWRLTGLVKTLMELWRTSPDFRLIPYARAINLVRATEGRRPKDGGRMNAMYAELGPDLSGLPAPSESMIRRLRGEPPEVVADEPVEN